MSLVAHSHHLQIEPTHEEMSRQAAELILANLRENPRLLLGAATGSTPTRTYELLAETARREPALFREMRLVKVDEWGGLAMDDPATCEVYLRKKLVEPLGISSDRYIAWNSNSPDPKAECIRIGLAVRERPIDLCVLGLGVNGHLAFNEPGSSLATRPHLARLSATSLGHPMLRESRGKPTFGLTLGMADILHSRRILLLVSGRHKAEQLWRLINDAISTQFPASFLQLHSNLTILCDAAAASQLNSPPRQEV
jgi:galactosamine-6-phosphate isomerase